MERQQALTILASAGASAGITAALLFLWLPDATPPALSADAAGVAALRHEVELLKEELAARSNALPSPMVAERVVEIEGGRARDELARRCDELEHAVAELQQQLANDSTPSARSLVFLPTYGTTRQQGLTQLFEPRGEGVFTALDAQRNWASQVYSPDVDLATPPLDFSSRR